MVASREPLYNAAGTGRRLKMWHARTTGPNSASLSGLRTILARAREAHRNDPWMVAATNKQVANAVGCGIRGKPEWGTDEQKAIQAKVWELHMQDCDADATYHGYGLMALAEREIRTAGEVFVRFRPRRIEDGYAIPMQVQMIQAEQCPAHYNGKSKFGNMIRCGVEFDGRRKRVAYWMHREHPGDYFPGEVNAQELVRVPADQILHVRIITEAGQIRGVPPSVAAMTILYNIRGANDNTLELIKSGSLFSLFYTTDAAADPALDPVGEDVLADARPEGVDGADADGTPLAGLEPGSAQVLPKGMKPMFSEPPSPGNNFEPFIKSQLMAFCACTGVPYSVVTGDLKDLSDRTMKLELFDWRRAIEMHQETVLIAQLMQPWRQRFTDELVFSGQLDVPNYADIRREVAATDWVPHGWDYSHPVQDAEADIKQVRGGLNSLQAIRRKRGFDSDTIHAQIVQDNAKIDDDGLVLDSDPRKTTGAGQLQGVGMGSAAPTTP